MARGNDKRSRLISSANELFHKQGVSTTTLANIAQLADVPLGNVYYYFKSKSSIVLAVIEHLRKNIQQQFEELNTIPDAKSRLNGLIKSYISNNKEANAEFGDVLGSLCQELSKQNDEISKSASALMQEIVFWCSKQFEGLGKNSERAQVLAANLVSSIQGICLLTLTFKDTGFADQQTDFLVNWLETA